MPIQCKQKLTAWAVTGVDYYQIGQRIRKYRKAKSLSQEQLAEQVGISVPHMSHIETGNTKLSLPVLVEIAKALEVQTDDLLHDEPQASGRINAELQAFFDSCTTQEKQIYTEILKAAKTAMDKYK